MYPVMKELKKEIGDMVAVTGEKYLHSRGFADTSQTCPAVKTRSGNAQRCVHCLILLPIMIIKTRKKLVN